MKQQKNKKLIVFTSVFKSEMGGIKDLLAGLGKKEVFDIHKEYTRRKFFGPWGLKELAQLYQGFSEKDLKKISYDYYLEYALLGIKEFISQLKEKGFLIGLLSANPQFMMDVLKENLFVDFSIGTQFEFKKGKATGRIKKEVNRYLKVKLLEEKIKEYGLKKENVVTIGRVSVSHLPIVKASGCFIGIDPACDNLSEIKKYFRNHSYLRRLFSDKK